MNEEILTLGEVSKYLKVDEQTIYRLSQQKRIPAFKVGGQWRYKKDAIIQWIDGQRK